MQLKDHYRTLGLTANATADDIKKAFRQLAHQYHPDKSNMDDNSAAILFRDVQEAYQILNNPLQKKAYDEQRYWAGLLAHKQPTRTTPKWLLQQAKQLQTHLDGADNYTINQLLLKQYLLHLLSDAHLAILASDDNDALGKSVFSALLITTEKLDLLHFNEVANKLKTLTNDPDLLNKLNVYSATKKREARLRQLVPLLVIIATCLLCVLMYYYTKIG